MSEEEARKIIDKIKQEEFPYALAIAKAYEKLQQENEELKKNLFSSDQVETICPKCGEKISINYSREVYDLKYTLTEFEKWLEEKIYEKVEPPFKNWEDERIEYYLNRREGFKECLDKLQELKEGSRSE